MNPASHALVKPAAEHIAYDLIRADKRSEAALRAVIAGIPLEHLTM